MQSSFASYRFESLLETGRKEAFMEIKQQRKQKTTIVLGQEQIAFLDELSVRIGRRTSGAVVDRSAIIRALIKAPYISKLDCSPARSGDEIATVLGMRIKK
jgi:hypothetical protein